MRGLNVDPAQRFATAREMSRALEQAIPLAMVSTVGDWVESAAKDTLDARYARVASVENDSSVQAQLPPLPEAGDDAYRSAIAASRIIRNPLQSAPAALAGPRRAAVRRERENRESTEPPSSPASLPPAAPSHARHPRGVWLAAAATAGLLLLAAIVMRVWTRPVWPAAAERAPAAPSSFELVSAPVVTMASVGPLTSSIPAPSSPSSAPAPSLQVPQTLVASPAASGGRGAVQAPSRPRTRTAPAPNCDPPFTLDEQGRKSFKPECY
jgi:serine/threonine-protein kinase